MPWFVGFFTEVRVKIFIAIIAGMFVSWIPAIISDFAWIHATRAESQALLDDYPIQKSLTNEKLDSLRKAVDHIIALMERANERAAAQEARQSTRRK